MNDNQAVNLIMQAFDGAKHFLLDYVPLLAERPADLRTMPPNESIGAAAVAHIAHQLEGREEQISTGQTGTDQSQMWDRSVPDVVPIWPMGSYSLFLFSL
jgi:hypothetical protein